jgi:hypothetical protein
VPDRTPIDAGEVLKRFGVGLSPAEKAIRSQRFLAAVTAAGVPHERVGAIAGE